MLMFQMMVSRLCNWRGLHLVTHFRRHYRPWWVEGNGSSSWNSVWIHGWPDVL